MTDRRANRREWQKRVDRWRTSGLTAKEFAAEMGINAGTLQFWSCKLKQSTGRAAAPRASRAAAPVASSLLEVSPLSMRDVDTRIEVELANGRRLRVPSTFDTTVLQKLVAALETTT